MAEQMYEKQDLQKISEQWDEELKTALGRIPNEWMEPVFNKLA
jgi:putative proteasome-type protease